MCVGLTPAGHLRWAPRDGDTVPAGIALLESAFAADWREALFSLAAGRIDTEGLPAARFWQQVAERYLTALCQLPGIISKSAHSALTGRYGHYMIIP